MPRVQNYTRQAKVIPLPKVRLTAAPNIEAAGQLGNTITRIGAEIYADEVRKQDEIAVMEADSKLSAWENQRLYDPKEGAFAKRGKDAFGLPDLISRELDDHVAELGKSLRGDRQQMAFQRRVESRRADITASISRHTFAEIRKHDDAETEAYLTSARALALANYTSPERVGLEIERQQAAIVDYANRNGLGAEFVKQKVAQVHSDTHVGVIDRMLANGQDQAAKQYFDTNRTSIAGNDVTKVEQKMLTATTEGDGMRAADTVWKTQGPKSDTDPVNVDSMAEALRTQFANDPARLKTSLAALKERAALHNAAQSERAQAVAGTVWRSVSQGATLAQITRTPEYLALPGKQQEEVRSYLVRQAEHNADRAYALLQRGRAAANRADEDATRKNFAAYLTYSRIETLNAMTENQIISLLPQLGRTLTGNLMEKKRAIVKGESAVRDAKIDDDLFKQVAHETGLRPYRPHASEEERATLGALKNAVEVAISMDQRSTGRPATRERKQQIMKEIIERKVKLDVWGRDPEKPAALVPADQRAKAYVPIAKVPKETVSEALNWLRSEGNVPMQMPEAEALQRFRPRIERAYAARLMGASRAEVEDVLRGSGVDTVGGRELSGSDFVPFLDLPWQVGVPLLATGASIWLLNRPK